MRIFRGLSERVRCLFRRETVERDLDDEIAYHLARETARNRAAGMTPDAAAAAARRAFGGVDRVKELHRDERGVRWILDFLGDIRYGARALAARPGLTTVALLALALGIGGNAAAFSVLDALLIRPLPLEDPDRLVVVWQTREERGDRQKTPAYDVRYWQQHAASFDGLVGVRAPDRVSLLDGEEPEQAIAARVTTNFFEVVGGAAAIGRTFTPADEASGDIDVAVLSHAYWSRRFAADAHVVGRTLTIDARATTVIGVMPDEFRLDFPAKVDLWMPRVYTETELETTGLWSDHVIARLAPGVTVAQARSAMEAVLERAYEETDREFRADGTNPMLLHEVIVGDVRPALLALLGAVALVLLIACANVANLLLARTTQRRDELALRAALGAGRGRLTRQLFAECLVLAGAGAAAAAAVGFVLLRGMIALAPEDLPRLAEMGMDLRVALFTSAVALGATLLFGTLPALRAGSAGDAGEAARSGQRGTVGSGERTLALLVAAESTLVVVLVFAAGAMLQRYVELSGVETGFRTDARVAAQLVLPAARYETPEVIAEFVTEVTARLERTPGVTAVGGAWTVPLSGRAITVGVPPIAGQPPRPAPLATGWDGVTPGYFAAVGIPLVSGRTFTAGDDRQAPHAVVINETLRRTLFGEGEAVGHHFVAGQMQMHIVGVVADTVHLGLDRPPRSQIYQPQPQVGFPWRQFEIVVATTGQEPLSLAGEIRRAVAAVDPMQPVADIRTLEQVAVASIREERFLLVLLGAFGLAALLLGAIGIYGVVGYTVAQRRREMGLRLTLGARPSDIRRLICRRGLTPVAIGLLLGCGLAIAAGGVIGRYLGGAGAAGTTLLAPVAGVVLLTATLAIVGPVRRATRADPLESLRGE